eukprot:1161263-Pelagomonas_calceolata.AAC.32
MNVHQGNPRHADNSKESCQESKCDLAVREGAVAEKKYPATEQENRSNQTNVDVFASESLLPYQAQHCTAAVLLNHHTTQFNATTPSPQRCQPPSQPTCILPYATW